MSDASEIHLQMDDRHIITPMAEGKEKKEDETTHSSQ